MRRGRRGHVYRKRRGSWRSIVNLEKMVIVSIKRTASRVSADRGPHHMYMPLVADAGIRTT